MTIEDLTTYTEVDPNSRLSKTSTRATATELTGNEDAYIYKDFEADHFNEINIDFEIYVSSGGTGIYCGLVALGNNLDDFYNLSNDYIYTAIYVNGSDITRFYIECNGTDSYDGSGSVETVYYCRLTRAENGTTVYIYIYTDSARTTLLCSASVSVGSDDTYRYLFAIGSRNSSNSKDASYYVQNINIHEADDVGGGGAIMF